MSENSAESRDFLVPDLGEGLEEASVVEWLVPVTGSVALNGPLCVLETAKATVEIPSPFAGRLVERGGEEGDTLTVGSLLARIQVEAAAPDANREHPSQASATRRTPTLVGYGADDEQDRSRRPGPVPTIAVSPPSAPPSGARPAPAHALAKPPVRRLARTLNVDLAALVPGSGRDGIVTRDDVLAAAPAIPTAAAIAAAPEPGSDQDADGAPAGDLAGKTVPVRGIRARIAERMTISRSRIPDATCSVTADCGALLDLRGRLNATAERAGAAPVITPFALIARLLVRALTIHPGLHGRVHLGVATATDHGLLVPVVRSAQAMSTLRLAQEIARLAETARAGTASPAELTGSTFTVSNFGALGLDEGIPVINYPEAAILGVGSIRSRAVVRNGEVVARPTATLTCAFDHRVADGAEAGAFLRELASWVEQPDLVLLHS
jgi:pyruvate dehydrogenase E2 component (dihydrolipoamide acetyltransferase)